MELCCERLNKIRQRISSASSRLSKYWKAGARNYYFYRGLHDRKILERYRLLGYPKGTFGEDEHEKNPTLIVNIFRIITHAMISKLMEHRVMVRLEPMTKDPRDLLVARIGQELVDNVLRDNHFNDKLLEAYTNLTLYGQTFIYVHTGTKFVPFSQERKVKIKVEWLHPEQVVYDLSATDITLKDARWAAIAFYVPREDLIALFPEHAEALEKAPSSQLPHYWLNREGAGNEFVRVWEYWEQASPANPDGLHALIVPSVAQEGPENKSNWLVLKAVPNYRHGELPIIRVVFEYSFEPFGDTVLKDLAALQQVLDYFVARVAQTVEWTTSAKFVYPAGAINPKEITNDPVSLLRVDPTVFMSGAKLPLGFLNPPPVEKENLTVISLLQTIMERLGQLTPIERGEVPKSETATGVAMLDAAMQRMFRPRLFSLSIAFKRMAEQILYLADEFFDQLRDEFKEWLGDELGQYVDVLNGEATKRVKDVWVDVGQEGTYSRAVRVMQLTEALRHQVLPLEDPMIRQSIALYLLREYNLEIPGVSEDIEVHRRRAIYENYLIKEGEKDKAKVRPHQNHIVHIQEHRRVLGGIEDADWIEDLEAHIKEHEAHLQAMALQMAQQVGAMKGVAVGTTKRTAEETAQPPEEAPFPPAPPVSAPPSPGGPTPSGPNDVISALEGLINEQEGKEAEEQEEEG